MVIKRAKTESPLRDEKETDALRKSWIKVVGDIPLGTHLCQFYETREDLIDILVPYFAEGLRNNEFCMWVTSEPLSEEEAEKAMGRAVPNFDRYLKRGQIEIVPHTEWYLKDGAFNLQRVLNAWIDKLSQALAKGYDGIRVTGNAAWLEKRDWKSFTDYEEQVNNVIGKYRMIAICTYPLDKYGASEVIDVVRNHQFALIKRRGGWEPIESSNLKRAKEALRRQTDLLQKTFDSITDAIFILDAKVPPTILECNEAASIIFGYERAEMLSRTTAFLHVSDETLREFQALLYPTIGTGGLPFYLPEFHMRRKDGSVFPSKHWVAQLLNDEGKRIGWVSIVRDITERKKIEAALTHERDLLHALMDNIPDAIYFKDVASRFTRINRAHAQRMGVNDPKEAVGKTDFDFYSAEFAREAYADEQKIVKMREPLINKTEKIRGADGQFRWVSATKVPIMDKEGLVTGIVGISRDITESKQAEEALRRSEEQARHLLEFQNKVIDTAVVWIDLLDEEGNVTLWNRAAELISGYSREEVVGHKKGWEWLYPDPKYRAEIFADAKKVIERGERVDIDETTIRCKDGTLRTISWYSNAILDERGEPVGSIAVGIDITEIKKAQEKIRESEEKLRGIFSTMTDGVTLVGLDGKILDCNDAVLRLHGVSRDKYVGRNVYHFIAPEDRQRAIQQASEVTEKGLLRSEVKALRKKGGTFDADINVSLLRDASGEPTAFLGVTRDITERKRLEEKLRQYSEHLEELVQKRTEELLESEKRYSVLVEEASDGVIIIQDGKIIFTNKRDSEISGYSKDELIGLSLEKLVDERYRQLVKERYLRRMQGEILPATYEVEFIAKTGERVPVEVSATRMYYQGRPADLVIVRDIRERKQLEQERLKLERLAAIGEVAAMVGHDLRNPLQAIVNTLYLAKKKLKSMPVTDKEILEKHGFLELTRMLMEQVEYMNKIVSDLQDYARPVKPEPVETSLAQLINEAISTITVPENVKVSKVIPEGFPKLVVDPSLMRRMFINLVTNALQAMPDGGQLTIRSSKIEETAVISVQDTGVGIPEEDLPKLFHPLFTTRSKGQGFGLAVCKRLVEAHDGSITVESKVGRGSIFTVKIPFRRR